MSKRHLFRESDGRFRQGSLERDMGIRTAICECGAINPYSRKPAGADGFIDPAAWDRPTHCADCGKALDAKNTGEGMP